MIKCAFDFWWLGFYFLQASRFVVGLFLSCSQFYQGPFSWLLVSQPLAAFFPNFSTNLMPLMCFVRKVTQPCLLESYPECSPGYFAFGEYLAAGEMSVLVAQRYILLTSQLLAVYGVGWGLWKTSVHEGDAAAAGEIEYWLTESEHSPSKSSPHQQINGNWKQSPAINSYKKKFTVPLLPSLSWSLHLFPSHTSSSSAEAPVEQGAMLQGKSESLQKYSKDYYFMLFKNPFISRLGI